MRDPGNKKGILLVVFVFVYNYISPTHHLSGNSSIMFAIGRELLITLFILNEIRDILSTIS